MEVVEMRTELDLFISHLKSVLDAWEDDIHFKREKLKEYSDANEHEKAIVLSGKIYAIQECIDDIKGMI